jgi:hypothetical protein
MIANKPGVSINMGQEDWDLLLQGAQDVQYRKGDVIVKEGEKHLRIYQLTSGSVDIIKNSPEGPKKLVTLFPKRASEIVVFGELTFLDPANQRVRFFFFFFFCSFCSFCSFCFCFCFFFFCFFFFFFFRSFEPHSLGLCICRGCPRLSDLHHRRLVH